MRITVSIVFAFAAVAATAGSTLEDGFLSPPMSARPQCWWHWMNGNVTREGITSDLEAMAEIGLGGATLFDAGCAIPPGDLKFNTPEWFEMVGHAASEARRLGLELCLPNCSGWSSSGGPWITPERGMKFLDFTEVVVDGPGSYAARLPPIPNPHGFAADIAVLACPVPEAERTTMSSCGVKISETGRHSRQFSFPKPYAATGISYRLEYPKHWANGNDGRMVVEASDDGSAYRTILDVEATLSRRGDTDLSKRFEPFASETHARHYRVTFTFSKRADRPPQSIRVAEIELGRRLSISHLTDKTLHNRNEVKRDAEGSPDQIVRREDVRDITRYMAPDGTLNWNVPNGKWRIIRLGYAANGRKNAPASDHGEGYEVDKLSAASLDYHFEQYAARLIRALGGNAGNVTAGLNGILVDSYEVGCQNWTQGLEGEFEKRRGYAMTPYMPVLAGVVVGSVDESERFLADYRKTVSELFAEGYSGALSRKCGRYGLKLTLEPYGNCPCDDLEYGGPADIPQGEFWSWVARDGDRGTVCGNVKLPSYLAHVWGRRHCGAEAFTADPGGGGRWMTTPYSIKAQGDRAFARGVNRLVFHRFAHQPWTTPARLPGMTMGRWGMHLDRTQTWWRHGRQWMDYLARCQWMLQEGTFAADVLFWHGEEAPSRGGHIVGFPQDYSDHPIPDGYDKDVCSTAALMKLRVENGKIVAPGGVRYSLLVLQDVDEMSPEVLSAVDRIVSSGGRIAAPRRPTRMPGLRNYPNGDGEIDGRSKGVWSKGVIAGGASEGLAAVGLDRDFRCIRAAEGLESETAWIHRVYPGNVDAYFVAAPNEKSGEFVCSFRVAGRKPELWDAEKGKIGEEPIRWVRRGNSTEVAFELPPSGSRFVVFREPTEEKSGGSGGGRTHAERTVSVSTPWRVTFPVDWYSGGNAKKDVEMARLVDWAQLEDPDFKYFSGTATYETRVKKVAVGANERVVLDLGEVKNFAEVSVNGRSYPVLWKPPFCVDVTDAVALESEISITVKVTNLWPNRLIGDDRLCEEDCEWKGKIRKGPKEVGIARIPDWVKKGLPSPTGRKTFTTWKHWSKEDDLVPSGMLGPVMLRVETDAGQSDGARRGRRHVQYGVRGAPALPFGFEITTNNQKRRK